MEQKIEIINNWNLRKIFREMEDGNIKIPRFQREFSWDRSKIILLLNSIYRQFPIGTFFLWVAPADYRNFVKRFSGLYLPENPDANYYNFILDGQQRITSLYVTLRGLEMEGTDYSRIAFDLEEKEFVIARSLRKKRYQAAWKLMDAKQHRDVQKELILYDSKKKTNYAEAWGECYDVFANYPVSVIKTHTDSLEEVVEIFERINHEGKRLTIFDLVHASTWHPDFDLKQRVAAFNKVQKAKLGGEIDPKVFTLALAVNIFGDCGNTAQLKLNAENCIGAWDSTAMGIRSATDFIRGLGIKQDLSPYHPFLPVIQHYFYLSGKKEINEQHQKEIKDWLMKAKFSNAYTGSSVKRVNKDARWMAGLAAGK